MKTVEFKTTWGPITLTLDDDGKAVVLAGLTLQAVTIIAGPALKPVVLSQHQELTSRLESGTDLTGLLSRQGFLDHSEILSRKALIPVWKAVKTGLFNRGEFYALRPF